MCKRITNTNWWDKRSNLANKPSLSKRTIQVIEQVMEDDEKATLGRAIEKLMIGSPIYEETIKKLKEDFNDIQD